MNKVFTDNGWEDYIYWQTEDRRTLRKINQLINDICRNGNEGMGKPEPWQFDEKTIAINRKFIRILE